MATKEYEMFWTKGKKELCAFDNSDGKLGGNVKYIGASSDGKKVEFEVGKIGTTLSRWINKITLNDKPQSKLEMQLGEPCEFLKAGDEKYLFICCLTPLRLIEKNGKTDYMLKSRISITLLDVTPY